MLSVSFKLPVVAEIQKYLRSVSKMVIEMLLSDVAVLFMKTNLCGK